MKRYLLLIDFLLALCVQVQAQSFPNPALLSTGQGAPGTIDPVWTVSPWYTNNPPNPLGLTYGQALINNSCAPGSWVNPATLPAPTNNGNWITAANDPCITNTIAGYLYFRLTLDLPASCDGRNLATAGNYVLYFSGYADNAITDVYVNGTSTGISGGNFSNPINFSLTGPWAVGTNYVDVQVWNQPNGGQQNPYGLLLVANSSVYDTLDSDGDGVPDIYDQCPCLPGTLANGCPFPIVGDTIICTGASTTLTATLPGTYLWSNGATNAAITVSPVADTRYSVSITFPDGYIDTASVNVTVHTLPVAGINPATVGICPGASTVLTASGGISYTWDNAATTASITVSPAVNSNYSVTVTDANTCTGSASSTVTINAPPVAEINPVTTAICFGMDTTLTAGGGAGYLWSNAANTAAITVSPNITTSYTVTVTDANSCTASTTATVTVNPLPVAAIYPAAVSICTGSATSLAASGGTAYVWSNAANGAAITVSPVATTSYSVTVTDANTCTATAGSTVTVNPLPTVAVNPVTIAICPGTSTALTASGGVSYIWSNAATTAAIMATPATNTTYFVTATDANTCSGTASGSVTINTAPTAVISPSPDTMCLGVSTTLTANGGVSYAWSNNTNGATVTVSPVTNTVYSVTATDINSCTGSVSSAVVVIPAMILDTTGTEVACNGGNDGAINLSISSGEAPYSYLWNTGASTQNVTGLAAGNYTVIVTDNAGCTATIGTTITQPAVLQLSSSSDNPTCETVAANGTITLSITGGNFPYQYNWSGTGGGNQLTNLAPGNYSVTVSDAHACSVSSAFTLAYIYNFTVQASPGVTISLGKTAMLGYSVSGNAGTLVSEWGPGNSLSCNDCNSPISSATVTTLYQIEVTNDSGCTAVDTVTVTVVPDYSLFVPNAFTPDNNGNNSVFKVYGNTEAIEYFDVQIFDRAGEKVFESHDYSFAWDGTYRGAKEMPGVFIWQMKVTFTDGHSDELRKGSITLLR